MTADTRYITIPEPIIRKNGSKITFEMFLRDLVSPYSKFLSTTEWEDAAKEVVALCALPVGATHPIEQPPWLLLEEALRAQAAAWPGELRLDYLNFFIAITRAPKGAPDAPNA